MENTQIVSTLELEQILSLLKRLSDTVGEAYDLEPKDPRVLRVIKAADRVRILASNFGGVENFDVFVGKLEFNGKPTDDIQEFVQEYVDTLIAFVESGVKNNSKKDEVERLNREISSYKQQAKIIVEEKLNIETAMARLAKENDNLEKILIETTNRNLDIEQKISTLRQLNSRLEELVAEFQRREFTYLATIKTGTDVGEHVFNKDSKKILLDSYQRQKTILLKSLTHFQEIKAKFGLNVPADVVHSISETEKELKNIEINIKNIEIS